MRKLDLKSTRAILHDWGNLARTGDVGELLHGFPTRNTLHKQMKGGGGGTDGLTPPELAVDRLKGYQAHALRADVLIRELPLIRRWCVVATYRDKADANDIAETLGTTRSAVFQHRQQAEEVICIALNALGGATPLEAQAAVED